MEPRRRKRAVADDEEFVPAPNISSIKNKLRRQEAYIKLKRERKKRKLSEKKQNKKERDALGEDAPPKKVPKTIENQRVYDETMCSPEDEEAVFALYSAFNEKATGTEKCDGWIGSAVVPVLPSGEGLWYLHVVQDEQEDEMASYFARDSAPKILITSSDRPKGRTVMFCKQLEAVIPNSSYYYRRGLDLKKIVPQAKSREYTDVIIINEDRGEPNGLVLTHLPDGPTAYFRLSSVRLKKEIKRVGDMTKHLPEVILNNFNTRLGHTIGRLLAALFPHDPEFQGRRVVTFHNQRDYVFFRHHRYQFRNEKRVGLHELGPRFTLKLRSLQKGTFDSKFGEYEWVHKRHEMETSRRRFFL